jgi:RHS repeat-associated protein/uncharacterized repeat protein (TIGR01451 family)
MAGITGSSGSYVNQYTELPFGETTTVSAALPNPFTFAGEFGVIQIGANLFDMRARDYTPATGQFLSNDPIGLSGGQTNIRQYAGNNPVSLVDASGLSFQTISYGISPSSAPPSFDGLYPGSAPPSYCGAYPGMPSNLAGCGCERSFMLPFDNEGSLTPYGGLIPFGDGGLTPFGDGGLTPYGGLTPNGELTPPLISGFGVLTEGRCGPTFGLSISLEIPTVPSISPPGSQGGGGTAASTSSHDPNEFIGPAGYGPQGFLVPAGALTYDIEFENDGGVAAQDVTVDEPLSPNLDWSTFQLGSFGFGPIDVTVPAGLTQYQTTVPYRNVDGTSLNVAVDLNFNVQTGLLTATFTSLGPITGQAPTGATDGFLPPDDRNGIGEGHVEYTIQPKPGLATGTAINQQASIVFDTNASIATPTVANTIDAGPPTSRVAPLPAASGTTFTVSWSGSDGAGPGIASYNVYVSDGGSPYTIWQSATTTTSATFTGQAGHTYSFYSIATDPLGRVQPTPTAAQATTTVNNPPPPPPAPPVITGEKPLFTRKLNKKHKPVLTGFSIGYSAAMSPATAGNAANYQVDWISTKRVKRKQVQVLHRVPIRVIYDAADQSVSLLLSGKQAFAQGGRITVISTPPSGVTSAAGVLLDGNNEGQPGDNGTFKILPRARGVQRDSGA